ncbi:class I SAM-dependent methyltransferase [Kutzneria kofuensis]|uniref:SAM-dependent methyltransferase n=1 Tax=Kutzneria kofuensis TaxID=103725 RepID=A0A7W9KCJ4_9PSEU|nr:class I SAM-dependent methyltransferase [Kutzneria kofuensis]MBB5890099.1 SAM-dependent methyltransferase [Kutzneria kofuensis]
MATFEELVAEGAAVPVDGWDFSWFEGRATEQRPSWGYSGLIAERMASVESALDIQTGGGEVLNTVERLPVRTAATEGWPPSLAVARRLLEPRGVEVVQAGNLDPLPFEDSSFELVVSRHPAEIRWDEIARVLRPGGVYLSQQVGAGSMHEVSEAMMGPLEIDNSRDPRLAAEQAAEAGLRLVRLVPESLRAEFYDIAAVVHFLRKVVWIVPGFTVDGYLPQLRALHERIESEGPFVAHTKRFLIEVAKP